jgi:hypothetical protein
MFGTGDLVRNCLRVSAQLLAQNGCAITWVAIVSMISGLVAGMNYRLGTQMLLLIRMQARMPWKIGRNPSPPLCTQPTMVGILITSCLDQSGGSLCKMRSILYHKQFDLWSAWNHVFVLLVFIGASGCKGSLPSANSDQLVDRSFLTEKPCEAPCWQGLMLDDSSEKDILDTLYELPFIDASTIYSFSANWLGDDSAIAIHYSCIHPVIDNCGTIRVAGDKLKSLNQTVGFELTLKTVVTKLGPPDYVDYGPIHPDIGGCDLTLYWPEQKIIARDINKKAEPLCNAIRTDGKIPPETLVTNLIYSVNEVFGPLPGGCCTRIPWPGFAEP